MSIAAERNRARNGRFLRQLRQTEPESREWLIWSRYHHAWHRRSSCGGAAGYTSDIAQAGLFVRSKALQYHDGDRNEAFHVTEKAVQLYAQRERCIESLLALEIALSVIKRISK